MKRLVPLALLLVAGCSASSSEPTSQSGPTITSEAATNESDGVQVDARNATIPPAPRVPAGPLDESAAVAVERVWSSIGDLVAPEDVAAIGLAEDARLAWLLADLMRFIGGGEGWRATVEAFNTLTGTDLGPLFADRPLRQLTDYLIAWDTPAPPGYAEYKERLFTFIEPGWQQFFDDEAADVDWRLISWGGVFIDDRPLGDLESCERRCIPALDDPPVTLAADGSWYPDDGIVFGVVVNGEARAYPKNIMEVHEMVNDTLGGRRIGMPYCTLCGSAQAFYTDIVPEGMDPLVLRTSGLLSRSNKVMYELSTGSMFDTFLGVALTGSLRELGYVLEPIAVVTSTWSAWKAEHPETTIVARDGGRGLSYPADPLRGRDDNGPIFPIGDVDPRLPVQEQVLGVIAPDGTPVAFPVAAANMALTSGGSVSLGGIELVPDGDGLRAVTLAGEELPSHQAFWFAWSQFRPDTALWQP